MSKTTTPAKPATSEQKSKMPVGKTIQAVSKKKVGRPPGKVAKPAAVARSIGVKRAGNPGLAVAQAARAKRATYIDSVTSLMANQRSQGISVAELAKIHHLSEKTVYSRLRAAARLATKKRVVIGRSPSAPATELATPGENQEIAYLRGRVDQLETFLSQFFSLGMKKLLRALAP